MPVCVCSDRQQRFTIKLLKRKRKVKNRHLNTLLLLLLLLLLSLSTFVVFFIAQNRAMQLMRRVNSCAVNKNVFNLFLNVSRVMSGARSSVGRLFHTRGPSTAKLRSPYFVHGSGTTNWSECADRRWRLMTVDSGWQDSWSGAMPWLYGLEVYANNFLLIWYNCTY